MSEIEVRLAGLEDCSRIVGLADRTLAASWSEDSVKKDLLDNNLASYLVAEDKDFGPVGFASAWTVGRTSDIMQLAVLKEFRRSGIGLKLLKELMKECVDRHASCEFFLEVEESNIAAIKLYEACGFKTTDKREKYYKDGGHALIMKKGTGF